MKHIGLVSILFLAACQADPSDATTDTDSDGAEFRASEDCPLQAPPVPSAFVTNVDIQRAEQLPYYAAAVADSPTGGELFGNVLLAVDATGKRVLHVNLSDRHLRKTMFAEIDITGGLQLQNNGMKAELFAQKGSFGSVSFNGDKGLFFQGTLATAKFEALPAGVFTLRIVPSGLQTWPYKATPNQFEKSVMSQLTTPIRIVGRLHGSCMTTMEGSPARVTDIQTRPDCVALLAHL
jgi:hypothetical protein